jgi:hypothetical protein
MTATPKLPERAHYLFGAALLGAVLTLPQAGLVAAYLPVVIFMTWHDAASGETGKPWPRRLLFVALLAFPLLAEQSIRHGVRIDRDTERAMALLARMKALSGVMEGCPGFAGRAYVPPGLVRLGVDPATVPPETGLRDALKGIGDCRQRALVILEMRRALDGEAEALRAVLEARSDAAPLWIRFVEPWRHALSGGA